MIFNYLKLAVRLLIRNPFFTFINVLGLSVGFAVFIVLWQYSQNELHSDQFHKDYERIVRLVTKNEYLKAGQKMIMEVGVDRPAHAVKLAETIPEIEAFTRIFNQEEFTPVITEDHSNRIFFSVKNNTGNENYFVETKVAYADPNVFNFFGIDLLQGKATSSLSQPNSVVLSQRIAHKYFDNEDPLNKVILLNDSIPFVITGVYADLLSNTHLEFEIILSMSRLEKNIREFTMSSGIMVSYFKLIQGVNLKDLNEKLLDHSSNYLKKYYDEIFPVDVTPTLILQPLKDVAFTTYKSDHFIPKPKKFLIILGWVAFLILIIAWTNYVNLTIAANNKRYKEIGARKTVGARPADFLKQYLLEATIINILSVVLGLSIIQLVKNPLTDYFKFYLPDHPTSEVNTWSILALILIVGILVTGTYPALSTIKISPLKLFRKVYKTDKGINLSKVLSVIQYSSAIVLIIGAFSIHDQLAYVLSRDIGIKKEGIVVIDLPIKQSKTFRPSLTSFSNQISGLSSLKGYTMSNNVVGDKEVNGLFIETSKENFLEADSNGGIDEHFVPFYGIHIVAGRNFLPNHPSDTNAIMLSERAIENLGFQKAEDIIGKKIFVEQNDWKGDLVRTEVIGVFRDYKRSAFFSDEASSLNNLKKDQNGIALTYGDYLVKDNIPRKISVSISGRNYESTIRDIEKYYKESFPGNAFNWYFLDENITRYYANEKIARNQITLFTVLAIGVACLGLLGMLSQKSIEKTKEIGVRKILGAGMKDIASVLLSATVRQIVLATIIGLPIAWYLTQQYLERYSERISLNWWHYAVPVLILIAIMFATIASLLIKAARTNPVESLRYE